MILKMSNLDAATLCLHLLGMRKQMRNFFKSNYKPEYKQMLESYDYIVKQTKLQLEQQIEQFDMHLNIKDLCVLTEFLTHYPAKVLELDSITDNDKAAMDCLQAICSRCTELLADVS